MGLEAGNPWRRSGYRVDVTGAERARLTARVDAVRLRHALASLRGDEDVTPGYAGSLEREDGVTLSELGAAARGERPPPEADPSVAEPFGAFTPAALRAAGWVESGMIGGRSVMRKCGCADFGRHRSQCSLGDRAPTSRDGVVAKILERRREREEEKAVVEDAERDAGAEAESDAGALPRPEASPGSDGGASGSADAAATSAEASGGDGGLDVVFRVLLDALGAEREALERRVASRDWDGLLKALHGVGRVVEALRELALARNSLEVRP